MNHSSRSLLVTAAVLYDGKNKNRILIARRRMDAKNEAGKWEFPGGKVEFCERPEVCLAREMKEELDLEIEVERPYEIVSHVFEANSQKVHIVMICFVCRVIGNLEPKAIDVHEAKWIEVKDLTQFDFAKADVPVVEKLLRSGL